VGVVSVIHEPTIGTANRMDWRADMFWYELHSSALSITCHVKTKRPLCAVYSDECGELRAVFNPAIELEERERERIAISAFLAARRIGTAKGERT
jgi:hypothetical protein